MMTGAGIPHESVSEKRVVARLLAIALLACWYLHDIREWPDEDTLRNHMVICGVALWTLRSNERNAAICTDFTAYHMALRRLPELPL